MTYGWAILVIAVVLAALYSLGIFNPNTFAPKASAGSCEVVRPFGPGTTTDIHLEGTCTNMLPKYVAVFNGGPTTNISIAHASFPKVGVSITAWVYSGSPNPSTIFSNGQDDWHGGISWQLGICSKYACVKTPNVAGGGIYNSNLVIPQHIWTFEAATIAPNGSKAIYTIYVNNQNQTVTANAPDPNTQNWLYIGTGFDNSPIVQYKTFSGSISNIQIYNTTLSTNQIQALYQEGIGGDPIELTHLIAWYPLNGNANDYSGNKNNGKEHNVGYSSTWYKTYSAP